MFKFIVLGLFVAVASSAHTPTHKAGGDPQPFPPPSRSINRAGPKGDVSLTEFNIKGVVYGRCSYTVSNGEHIAVLYEQKQGEKITARSENPTVVDPVSHAIQCKKFASTDVLPGDMNELQGRNGMISRPIASTSQDIRQRFANFRRNLFANTKYVEKLEPRFLGIFGGGGGGGGIGDLLNFGNFGGGLKSIITGPDYHHSNDNHNIGISFGDDHHDEHSHGGGINLMNTNPHSHSSIGLFNNHQFHETDYGNSFNLGKFFRLRFANGH